MRWMWNHYRWWPLVAAFIGRFGSAPAFSVGILGDAVLAAEIRMNDRLRPAHEVVEDDQSGRIGHHRHLAVESVAFGRF